MKRLIKVVHAFEIMKNLLELLVNKCWNFIPHFTNVWENIVLTVYIIVYDLLITVSLSIFVALAT